MVDYCPSCALRHKTVFLHDGYDVGQIHLRADLQVSPKAFLNEVPSPFAVLEHPKQVVSIGCKELVGSRSGITELKRAIGDAEQAIDQHSTAHGVFQAETAMLACAHNEDVEAGTCEPARGGSRVQE